MSSWPNYKRWRGMWNMGRPRVPPLPQFVSMLDRMSDDQWYLSFTGESPALELALTVTRPSDPNVATFFRYTGPYTPDGNWRLYVENGVLLAEAATTPGFLTNPQTYARRGYERTLLRIDVDEGGAVSTTEVAA